MKKTLKIFFVAVILAGVAILIMKKDLLQQQAAKNQTSKQETTSETVENKTGKVENKSPEKVEVLTSSVKDVKKETGEKTVDQVVDDFINQKSGEMEKSETGLTEEDLQLMDEIIEKILDEVE